MPSYPTGATLHRFLCGVAPVGQVEMEGIWAFHTDMNRSVGDFRDVCDDGLNLFSRNDKLNCRKFFSNYLNVEETTSVRIFHVNSKTIL